MKKYFSTCTQSVKINGIISDNALMVNGIQYSNTEIPPFGVFEYKDEYGSNIIGKMFTFENDSNGNIINATFTTIDVDPLPPREPTNSEVLQTLNDLRADLEIAGVI